MKLNFYIILKTNKIKTKKILSKHSTYFNSETGASILLYRYYPREKVGESCFSQFQKREKVGVYSKAPKI